mgnify:CR=1 FL=1
MPESTDQDLITAARAVLGERGILAGGRDYRGVPVLAYAAAVAGTPWLMLAEIDEREAYTGIRTLSWGMGVVMGLGLLLVYSAGYLMWRRDREQQELSALQARQAAEARFRVVFEQAPLGVVLLDPRSGLITEANARFGEIVGRPAASLVGVGGDRQGPPDEAVGGLRRRQESLVLRGFEQQHPAHGGLGVARQAAPARRRFPLVGEASRQRAVLAPLHRDQRPAGHHPLGHARPATGRLRWRLRGAGLWRCGWAAWRVPAAMAALLNVLAFDFFFVPPRFTFAVSDLQYLLTFAVLLAVALSVTVFRGAYEQVGNTVALWADTGLDRAAGAFTIPMTWFQSLNPLLVMLMTPPLLRVRPSGKVPLCRA